MSEVLEQPAIETPAAPVTPVEPVNVLASGATPPGTPAAIIDPNAWMPEKFRVLGEDKSLNIEASARKVAEAYGHAEKRIGTGDLPPKTAEEYKVNVPEALAEKIKSEDLSKDPMMQTFLKDAHAKGFTQAQVDMALAAFLERAPAMMSAAKQLSEQEATAALKETWKSETEYKSNVSAAFKAGQHYAGADFDGILEDYGNDPRIVRMLANVGKEMHEDTSAPAGSTVSAQADLEKLTKSEAYFNPKHADHLSTKQKVNDIMLRMYGTGPKATGPVVIST